MSLTRMLLTASLMASSAAAMSATPDALAAFTRDLSGLDGRFVQRVFDPDQQLVEQSEGRVALSVPRQFRWEYETPSPQLIVADGDHIWIYDPDLEQVQVRRQSFEEQQSPLAALIDPDELQRQFTVSEAVERDGLSWVELTPRGDEAQFEAVRLGLRDGELMRMDMSDALGQRTEVSFDGWRRNPRFDPGAFTFTPPAGVDVIGEIGDSAEVYPIED